MPVGFREGISFDGARRNWDDSGPRPLSWSAWYPASKDACVAAPATSSWFKREPVAWDARLASSEATFPLVLLSHGSGSSTAALEWLAYRLAQCGYVALGVNHHGHTGGEPYRAEGFLCLWERARDFSALLDDPSWRHAVGGAVDNEACVAGFSAGAYTAMLLMGARVAYSQFEPGNPVKSPIRGPREFPDLIDELPRLRDVPVFRESWERRRSDYTDPRIKRAAVIAPGRSVLGFAKDSLQTIRKPIQLYGGGDDTVAPPAECCEWLHKNVPGSTCEIITGVGHYTFLPEGTEIGDQAAPELFQDKLGVERRAVHACVAQRIAGFCGCAPVASVLGERD
ncbi:alpha/beta hydrolase family protein [Rhizobium herbae]|uniref:Dienelactone hydrolase n=1 Tax=Rhizobium herbae TaxID=508661 RepID=A0ABS4ELK5_9HYPH|nr:alpha/beta fold hydrolase [Rhizobium herbae]MBP1858835.1 putative dienelactone hydrolase [Rhizobium herbae]